MNYLLAILLPPVAVLAVGAGTVSVLLNIVLTLAGFIPGLLHALYVVHGAEKRKAAQSPITQNFYQTPPPPTR